MGKKINYKQIGSVGLETHGGYIYEEFIPKLRWPRAGRVYQEMADNDPVVGAILYLAEMLIRRVEWNVEPASDSEEDKEKAVFLEQCMEDMDMSWADTISEIMSVLTYGFSFHEVVYKVRRGPNESSRYRSKHTDGKIGWRRMPIRSQNTLHSWKIDDDGDIKAFVQLTNQKGTKVIPLSKGLLFRTRVSRDNPEGKSLLRNAYRPWYFKKHIEEIEGIGIERDLAGFPVLEAPEGLDLWNDDDERMVALRQRAEDLVKNIRRDSEEGALMPHGWNLKLLSTGSSRQFDTNAIIDRYDNRIAITMLSDLILLGSDGSGSFALADTKKTMLGNALEAQVQKIADVINKYAVPKLFMYNNFTGETPKIRPGNIETPSLKELALLLRSMDLDISNDKGLMNYLRKISSMPTLDDETFQQVYQGQHGEGNTVNNDDTVDNDFEQSDLHYTGQEE